HRFRYFTDSTRVPSYLHVLGDPQFWNELKEAEAITAPLWLASYCLQRDQNTVGDVVHSFRDIYKGFQQFL
ncbi:hypothetical protein F441_15303, partial [Phytophthora nicotianae CJ01A1]